MVADILLMIMASTAPTIINTWVVTRWSQKKMYEMANPTTNDSSPTPNRSKNSKKYWSLRLWLLLSCMVVLLLYTVDEVFGSGPVTRMSVFKIVFGVGGFFFLLLQSTIVQTGRSILELITAPSFSA